MSKTIQMLTILMLAITLVGCLITPNNPAFWLASSSLTYTVARGGLIFIIYALLLFGTPPNKTLRSVLGLLAFALLGWAMITTYNETTQFLDGLSFMAAGVSIFLSILQPDYGEQGAENWGIVTEKVRPRYGLLERQIAYYALIAFMVFDINNHSFQAGHHLKNMFT